MQSFEIISEHIGPHNCVFASRKNASLFELESLYIKLYIKLYFIIFYILNFLFISFFTKYINLFLLIFHHLINIL